MEPDVIGINRRHPDEAQIGLGEIADLIFGPERKERLLEAGIDTPRAVWELSDATTQCRGVLPNIEDPTGTLCYICDMAIDNTKTGNGGKIRPSRPGLEGECEHKLAIAQAIIFLGLYWTGIKKFPEKFPIYEPLKNLILEYKWAHHTCNQIKSDRSFIQFNVGKQLWEPNVAAILKLLEDIYHNHRVDSSAFNFDLHNMYKKVGSFTKARLSPVVSEFKKICVHINRQGAPGLVTLAGWAKVLEGPMNPRARELLDANTNTLRFNTNGLKMLTNAALGFDILDRIKNETKQLLPIALKTKETMAVIEGQGVEHIERSYVKLLLSEPNTAEPYLKILFLRRLSEYLRANGSRQHVTITRLANLLTTTSKLSESTMAELTSELEGYMREESKAFPNVFPNVSLVNGVPNGVNNGDFFNAANALRALGAPSKRNRYSRRVPHYKRRKTRTLRR